MRFLGAFAVIFLLIFAAAMLGYLLWRALKSGSTERVDVYVKPCDNLEEFIINARRSDFIGAVYIVSDGSDGFGELVKSLTEKYDNVMTTGK